MGSEDLKRQAIRAHIAGLITRLENWVRDQKKFMDELQKYGDYIVNQDRLSLLLSAQAMLYYIERTLKDFESWLNNPMITSIMPVEMLKELEERLRDIAIEFVKLDIDHTSKYIDMLKKIESTNEIPDILKLYIEQRGIIQQRGSQGEQGEVPRFM
ncbi:MAG: DUF2153 domain-containing protein [Vulcanisaeta sp.]|jgi:hypothetical protein|nr:DUF2153 domain-containing protein [Vulcanisaeta sp.]MCG2869769.1 DUF2153 domain-containing protein [Vulcanisaeta sp.]MCG2879930.1 DUF2153 domain-containing protein [Vulcanisaeta sp.]MCG2887135.1 DUF2153 domain-containing protein [Vulcanisaeta sp.]